jgi:hypothetical protein
MNAARRQDGINVSYKTAYRGKYKALEPIIGNANASFKNIGPFIDVAMRLMPGSLCTFDVDPEDHFL